MPVTPSIAVVYFSGFGHTRAIAECIAVGARRAGAAAHTVDATTLPPDGKSGAWDTLHSAAALVFGSPTYMGSIAAKFKTFMECTGAVWKHQAWKDKLAAGFTVSGSPCGDNLNVLTDLALFAAQHSMIWVSLGVFSVDGPPESAATANRLGSWLGLATQADNAPPEVTPPASDRATAEAFGERIALAAQRWGSGSA